MLNISDDDRDDEEANESVARFLDSIATNSRLLSLIDGCPDAAFEYCGNGAAFASLCSMLRRNSTLTELQMSLEIHSSHFCVDS